MGSGLVTNELVELVMQLVAKEPHSNHSFSTIAVVIA